MRPARCLVRALRTGCRRRNNHCHAALPGADSKRGRFRGYYSKDSLAFLGFRGAGVGGAFYDGETRTDSRNTSGADSQGRCSANSSCCDCREDPMKRLIVNADDFGLTENVNRGILDAHREGIVTSTTLLANGMAFESD